MNDNDESIRDLLRKIPADLRQLLDKRLELIELQITERTAQLAGKLIYKVAGVIFLYIGLILLLWAGGFYLGDILDSLSAGFAILALIVIVFGAALYKYHTKSMIRSVKNRIIKAAMEKEDDDEIPRIEKKNIE